MRPFLAFIFYVFCALCDAFGSSNTLHHFVFFNRDHDGIKDPVFLTNQSFRGAQLKFTWRELEPEKDRYHLTAIDEVYTFLKSKGKLLFIQVQDTSFDEKIVNVPDYLLREAEFNGGADRQYEIKDGKEENAVPAGWVARRFDPAVQKRFQKLLVELGKQFDGRIHGINLPETSVDFGETGRLHPKGFTPELYKEALISNMKAARAAFTNSVVIQYSNFMPGEWLPNDDRGYLKSIFAQAREHRIGVGGPDLLPFKPGQMKHSYPLIRNLAGIVPTGIAVQWGNYEYHHPHTSKPVTIPELIRFAQDYLKVNYIFWCTQEPFYSKNLIPYLANER